MNLSEKEKQSIIDCIKDVKKASNSIFSIYQNKIYYGEDNFETILQKYYINFERKITILEKTIHSIYFKYNCKAKIKNEILDIKYKDLFDYLLSISDGDGEFKKVKRMLSDEEKKELKIISCPTKPFIQIIVKQNTDIWHVLRSGKHFCRIGSSEIGEAAGLSWYSSPYNFFDRRVNRKVTETTEAMLKGTLLEDKAAEYYETVMKSGNLKEAGYLVPNVKGVGANTHFQENDDLLFGVSLDRFGANPGDCHVEIKCPYSKQSFERNYVGKIKYTHLAQMHVQMAVCNVKSIHYCVVFFVKDENKGYYPAAARIAKVKFSEIFWKAIVEPARYNANMLFLVNSGQLEKDLASKCVHDYFEKKNVMQILKNKNYEPEVEYLHEFRSEGYKHLSNFAH